MVVRMSPLKALRQGVCKRGSPSYGHNFYDPSLFPSFLFSFFFLLCHPSVFLSILLDTGRIIHWPKDLDVTFPFLIRGLFMSDKSSSCSLHAHDSNIPISKATSVSKPRRFYVGSTLLTRAKSKYDGIRSVFKTLEQIPLTRKNPPIR